jgi:Putative transmembrane protein (Alph_Pro_TM)
MKRGHRSRRGAFIVLAAMLLVGVACSPNLAQNIQVHPAVLKIMGFFGGTRLQVSGDIPAGTEAVFEVIGPKTEQELMRKGRRWDLWMNVGEIDITGVPRFYLVASSDPGLLSPADEKMPWGYSHYQRHARFQGSFQKGEESLVFQEFVQLKEEHGLYGKFPGAVRVVALGGGRSRALATFPINTRIAPGHYRVRLTAVRGQQIVQRGEVPWQVELAGGPAFLIYLATQRPVLYGLLALGLTAMLGFLSGVLFKQRGKPGGH